MKELRFEEKGTWVSLSLEEMKHQWRMDSNQTDYRQWPENISKSYSEALMEHLKTLSNEQEKLEMFFHAKGIATKNNLYKLLFRGIEFSFSEEQLEYIEQTKKEAEHFFENGIISF